MSNNLITESARACVSIMAQEALFCSPQVDSKRAQQIIEERFALLVVAANRQAHSAALPQLVAFVHNVIAAIEENGAETNLQNMLGDAREVLAQYSAAQGGDK